MAKKKHWKDQSYHIHPLMTLFISVVVLLTAGLIVFAQKSNNKGFDEFGYNYRSRIFQGSADGVDRTLDGTVWGDPFYGSDHLVMKWSKAWDEARFGNAEYNCDAWTNNEWNGKKNGSGETWVYKIVWVGPEKENSSCWREGGYSIWNDFEVIMSQGTVANEHFWDAHAIPAGYGMMAEPLF